MPGYGLAPADKFTATYDILRQELSLEATGTVPKYLHNFKFSRETIYGGLKFSFNAWYDYAFMGEQDLDHRQAFHIPNLKAIDPEMTVNIIDSNYPKGQVILIIDVLHVKNKSQSNGAATTLAQRLRDSDGAYSLIPMTSLPDPVELLVFYKKPFTINRSSLGSRSVQIEYNDSCLILETAGYESGDLYWTLNSLQTGVTEVIISAASDIVIHDVPIITKYIFVITVLPQISILPFPPPTEILSFKGRVSIAQREVQKIWRDAALINVSVSTPHRAPHPVKDPLRLTHMRCLFNLKGGTVSISSTGWGTFGPPEYKEGVFVGAVSFDIEDKTIFDITDAAQDMVKTGINEPFFSCELSEMLALPPREQPYYGFAMENASHTFVGAKDGIVRNVPAVLKGLPGKTEAKQIQKATPTS